MEALPREIVELIVSSMDAKTKKYFRQTCTRLFDIVDLRNFTFYFTRSAMLPEIVQTLSRYSKPISLTFTKTINLKPQAINYLSTLTNITSLEIAGRYDKDVEKMSNLTQLTNLRFLQFMEYFHYAAMLTTLKQLDRVNLRRFLLAETKMVLKANSNLRHLDLWTLDNFEHIQNIDRVTHIYISNFRGDNYESMKALEQARQLQHLDVFSNHPTYMPLSALTALKSLKLITKSTEVIESATGLACLNLEQLTIGGQLAADVTKTWTALTSLKELTLHPEGESNEELLQFLTALSNLSSFALNNVDEFSSFNCLDFLPDTLTCLDMEVTDASKINNIARLTRLQILRILDYRPGPWDYYFLTALTHLTQLTIDSNEARDSLTCIGDLTSLKSIIIYSYDQVLNSGYFNFSKLVNLEKLDLPSVLMTADTLTTVSLLSNLTDLAAVYDIHDVPRVLEKLPLKNLELVHEQNEEFWQSLVQITTLESLKIRHIHSEDIILSFSGLQNLTQLEVVTSAPFNYTCLIHLTSLQYLKFPALRGISSEALMDLMPYLYYANLN